MKKHRNVYFYSLIALMSFGGMFAPGGKIGSTIAFAVMLIASVAGVALWWGDKPQS